MEKIQKRTIYEGYVVYDNDEEPLLISEIIALLTQLKDELGDGYLWKWDDGIMKTIKSIGVRSDASNTVKRIELSL